ncbi:ABC-F family ATP-binding cassette domain-containing protein [Hyphomicrobiales bacterium]|nr:ABC-F family ATP-binding cassette domain-containing protein [Hyphomicrobiales bacterium]CAH1699288.1 ABC-F family ATP-binding cassette domain-containing protein [Hyphomicrobiales bacterium]CAI0343075.1 ABC-F family ATP-binding cassette domain-containing protein [Hyphomicrobiales bacterium]
MSLIAIKALSLVRTAPLFAGLDLAIAKGDRLGLVAANGRGKSSLLRIMAGMEEATSGTLTRSRGLVTAFAPQDPPARLLSMSLYDAVCDALDAEAAETESWRVDVLLDDLMVDESLRHRPVCSLSGGWQRTMLLARAAVVEPDLLLLDEPTNHLDLERIGVLERFLAGLARDCAVIAASHDRAFLDDVTTRTLFLRPVESVDFALPYSRAIQALEERDAARGRQFENDMRKVRALRQQAAKLKNIGINSGSDLLVVKTRQLSERADRLEENARPAHKERSAGAIRLTNGGTHARALVALRDTVISTPDERPLFRTGQLWIENGDRIALLGANGSGKTRFVTRLREALHGQDPDIRAAASLKAGFSGQTLAQLDIWPTPWEAVKGTSDIGDQWARTLLAGAGIASEAQNAPLSRLSGGQRARLAMLLLRLAQPNFYLLDEPTNHLDIEGQDMLERELVEHGAACLLVSHDRAFVRAVATRFWVILGKKLIEVDDPDPVFDRLMAG